jgi:exosome complex component RRP42
MQKIVWELETEKTKKLLQKGIRADGRKFDEFRPIELTTGISHNADGSCRIKLGKTDVMVGIKCTIGEPYPDSPDEGSISVNAEFLPIACDEYETGPPSDESIETSRVVDRGIREAKAIDFKKLLIKEREKVWVLWADIYPVNFDGNLFDSASIAVLKAFEETRLPKLDSELRIIPYEFDKKIQLERYPVLSTFAKIDHSVLLDPTRAEEKAAKARFSVAVTEDEFLTAFQKGGGSGSFSASEISQCIETAMKRTKEIRKKFF